MGPFALGAMLLWGLVCWCAQVFSVPRACPGGGPAGTRRLSVELLEGPAFSTAAPPIHSPQQCSRDPVTWPGDRDFWPSRWLPGRCGVLWPVARSPFTATGTNQGMAQHEVPPVPARCCGRGTCLASGLSVLRGLAARRGLRLGQCRGQGPTGPLVSADFDLCPPAWCGSCHRPSAQVRLEQPGEVGTRCRKAGNGGVHVGFPVALAAASAGLPLRPLQADALLHPRPSRAAAAGHRVPGLGASSSRPLPTPGHTSSEVSVSPL